MAYRRPGVTVTQEFVGLAPALAAFTLPSVVVGPAFQLVDNDPLGTYASIEALFPYAGLLGGAIVDLEELASDEQFPITKKPISVMLKSVVVEVLAEQTTGAVSGINFSDLTASQFADVVPGDIVVVGSNEYIVRSVTDDNNLVLQSPMPTTVGAVTYSINRKAGDVALDRVASTAENGFVPSADGVTLPASLTVGGLVVVSGYVYASYRALRIDLATEVRRFNDVASLNSVFGVGQILPSNPLAYGLSIMLQNTVTPVNGLGLDANAIANEVLSYTASTDVLKRGDMYAIAPLSHNPVVHTLFKNHVDQLSAPERKLERVVIVNSLLPTVSVIQEELTTSTSASGARQIVPSKLTGSGVFATSPTTFIDPTLDVFANVAKGDNVVVVAGGTGTILGTYLVNSKTDNNTLVFSTAFLSSGSPSDIEYYIYRKDGLAAGGASFYDRNASFLSSGVSSGHYLNILSGSYMGRYKIATVVSDKEVTLLPVVSAAVSLVTGVTYQVDRDLAKYEQADAVKGYSESFADRRVVHCWPDILQAPIGQTVYDIPGYFGCCSVAALTTGLPTQQGFTNLALSGFLGFKHSTRYFTEEELDNIADGGTMIFAQDGADQPLYVRHQLTTDRSAIKFQEFSITKNVDFIAKFWRVTYAKFIGQYNIVDTTMDALKTTAGAGIKFLKDNTKIPRFGGVIRSGNLTSIKESDTQIDTVLIRFSFGIPVPLNHIDITIEV
jgi:hypothetical protein